MTSYHGRGDYFMLINSDLLSSAARRKLLQNESVLAKSFEKLSSGKKVNGAADDASALSMISQMESQLSAANASISNDQFNQAMYQIADGALSQVGSMLSEMNALAIRAGNSTLTSSDRAAISAQMSELTSQISTIQGNTSFNGQAVFNQNFQVMADKTKPSGNTGGAKETAQTGEAPAANGGYEAVVKYMDKDQTGGIRVLQNPFNVSENSTAVFSAMSGHPHAILETSYVQKETRYSGPDSSLDINGVKIAVRTGDTVGDVVSRINSANSSTGVIATTMDSSWTRGDVMVGFVAGKIGPEYAAQTSNPNLPGKYTYGPEGAFTIGGDASARAFIGIRGDGVKSKSELDDYLMGGVNAFSSSVYMQGTPGNKNGEFIYEITDKNSELYGLKVAIDYNMSLSKDFDSMHPVTNTSSGFELSFRRSSGGAGTGAVTGSGNNGVRNSNAGNSQGNAPTMLESLNSMNLSTTAGASAAMNTISNALNEVNRLRAGIGGNLNRIESDISSQMIKRENVTAALSKLQDTDMAVEVANFTKNMIQDQAGMAVLAHNINNQRAYGLLAGL